MRAFPNVAERRTVLEVPAERFDEVVGHRAQDESIAVALDGDLRSGLDLQGLPQLGGNDDLTLDVYLCDDGIHAETIVTQLTRK